MQIRAVVAARRLATAALRSPARSIRTHKESVLPSLSAVASLRTRSFASSSHGFRCNDCGQQYVKWQGQCTACNTWGAIAAATTGAPMYSQPNAAQFSKSKVKRVAWVGESESSSRATAVFRMQEVETATFAERIQLPNKELVRLLSTAVVSFSF
jgi:predicted ATP-dependent serine protease